MRHTIRTLLVIVPLCIAIGLLHTLFAAVQTNAAPLRAGAVYYVGPSGSDSNDGRSEGSAFKTIQKGITVAQPGDTINLLPGTYAQDLVTVRNGTADAPITLKGPPSAVVKGGGNGRIFQVHHDYMVFDGFTIDGQNGSTYRGRLIFILGTEVRNGVTGTKIRNMTLKNAGGECVRLRYFVQQTEISNNTIGPCGRDDYPNGVWGGAGKNGEGIYIGTAPEQLGDGKNPTTDPDQSNDNWVHHNTFDTQGNECVDIKEAATRNLVEHNRCTGNKDENSAGFDSRGNGNIFRYNLSYGNVGAGIRLGGDTSNDGKNNDIYGNTIRDNKAGGIKFQIAPQGVVCGNVMAGNTGGDAVGSQGGVFKPASPCTGTLPSDPPPPPPAPQPTQPPTAPTEPSEPTEPSDPSEPSEPPTAPTQPPTAPTEPSEPSEPTAPSEPTQPEVQPGPYTVYLPVVGR